jgi:SAM-dependent methyltransferase
MPDAFQPLPHSAAFLNEQRDFWWNVDFVALMAERLGLRGARDALDLGAGLGHWTTTLLPLLHKQAHITGLERDARWVDGAQRRAAGLGVDHRCTFVVGVAEELPFAPDRFDLVTCQTLLIHVADVQAVLREMIRVLRPGGLLVFSEPNNIATTLVGDSISASRSIPERLERTAFALTCERGKAALGEGDNSVGDLLPGYCAELGLTDVRAWTSDRTFALVPPYASDAEQALIRAMEEEVAEGRWGDTKPDAKRYFLAGGGRADRFESMWANRLQEDLSTLKQIRAGTLHTAGGGVHYMISGRRSP